MTETTQSAGPPAPASQLPMTGSRGRPLKMTQYLAAGKTLAEAVNRYRQEKSEPEDGAASAETPFKQHERSFVECNKPKSYKLPRLATPTPIPGFPLAPSRPREDVPDYETIGRAKRLRRSGRVLLELGLPSCSRLAKRASTLPGLSGTTCGRGRWRSDQRPRLPEYQPGRVRPTLRTGRRAERRFEAGKSRTCLTGQSSRRRDF
jgi:hypothetical protein